MILTGAQITVEILKEQSVDTVFGYPGGSVLNIFDALYSERRAIRCVCASHEQGACHAADGYARASGKCGVVIATSGPGATNLVTALAAAYLDSSPIVAITGNVSTASIGKDSFQEVDICSITMPITKHNYIVKDIRSLAQTLRNAFAIAQSGRCGPVLVDIPKDVAEGEIEFDSSSRADYKFNLPDPPQKDLLYAASKINTAKRPVIYAGGGVVAADAYEELERLSDALCAPVACSMMGLTALSSDNPRYLGLVGMHGIFSATEIIHKCDLLIALGVRFSDRAMINRGLIEKGTEIIQIDIDAAEIDKNMRASCPIVGDIKRIIPLLAAHIRPTPRKMWQKEHEGILSRSKTQFDMDFARLNPQLILERLADVFPDACVATDVGQHQMWTAQYFRFRSPRTFITSGGLGAMGFGMGAAIGACIACGGRKTLMITSDGSFHMSMGELAAAVTENLPIVIVLMNNRSLGMVRQLQRVFFDSRFAYTSLNRKTDFAVLAQAMGAHGIHVEQKDQLDAALEEAKRASSPILLDCTIDPDEMVLPMIPPGGDISEIILR
ncbi:MAG: biosynthetic-type acetolactate synthase large subunit [Clostridia bacterium]|nr:biosynthetic-type acetolactate synthase large subunit [Clostridia bacterium]